MDDIAQGALQAQNLARDTMQYLASNIREGMSEAEIMQLGDSFMSKRGASFWYHGVGTFTFVGKRTAISMSGRDYRPSSASIGKNDIVTIDLSPQLNGFIGDYARTLIIEDGVATKSPSCKEFLDGIEIEKKLHGILIGFANPRMTFEELYHFMNNELIIHGYENLDFRNNLGHALGMQVFIENGCRIRLRDVPMFTFEPHIRRKDGEYGYKWEDIYYFEDGMLQRL